ncbi:MAG: preprotein translocase subunit SecE [Sporichthyaceae bacterium]
MRILTDTREIAEHEGPAKKPAGNRVARIGLYYRQVVAELRKVIWPTRNELINYTWVVLIFVAIMIAFVSTADYLFSKAVLEIFG